MTTSSDGYLTVTASDPTASHLITVDFSALAPAPTINLMSNPNNETAAGWTAGASSAVTQSSTLARTGTNSSRLTRSSGSGSAVATMVVPVLSGAAHTQSVYIRSAVARSATISVQHRTSTGANTGSATTSSAATTTTGTWTRYTVTATAPTDARDAVVTVSVASVASSSEFHYLDDGQSEAGSTATAYCDGSQPGCMWTGTVNGSMSVRPAYDRVTVTRADGTIVRGLDGALAPGSRARGVDHEAPLGVATVYTASVTNGTATLTSTTATATSGIANSISWLKSLRYPALSVAVTVAKAPDWSDDIPTGAIYPIGTGVSGVVYPNVTQGQRQADRDQIILECPTKAARDALLALLRSPGPFLLQLATNSQEPDQYVAAGAVQRQWVTDNATEPWRTVPIPLTAVARPPTTGSTVAIPGHTYADSRVAAPLYSNRSGTYGSR